MAAIVATLFVSGLVLSYRLTPAAERWQERDRDAAPATQR
jgi:hypothetical protein